MRPPESRGGRGRQLKGIVGTMRREARDAGRAGWRCRLAVVALAGLVAPGLAGCSKTGLAVGAAATVGSAASSERGLGTTISDDRIWLEINQRWLAHDGQMFQAVSLQVHEGRVLLTGRLERPEMRLDAVRLAWEVDGVREVIDETEIAEPGDLGDAAQDHWIASRLRSKILFDREVRSINYSIETIGGVVYLMGIAQSAAELQRVIDHARDISYVRQVVSYVVLKDDPARQAAR